MRPLAVTASAAVLGLAVLLSATALEIWLRTRNETKPPAARQSHAPVGVKYSKPSGDEDETPQTRRRWPARAGTAAEAWAEELAEAFRVNPVAANDKYAEKLLVVVGCMTEVWDGANKGCFVTLSNYPYDTPSAPPPAALVICAFAPAQRSAVGKLQLNHRTVIRGRCGGKRSQSVLLTDCAILSQEDGPFLKIPNENVGLKNLRIRRSGQRVRAE